MSDSIQSRTPIAVSPICNRPEASSYATTPECWVEDCSDNHAEGSPISESRVGAREDLKRRVDPICSFLWTNLQQLRPNLGFGRRRRHASGWAAESLTWKPFAGWKAFLHHRDAKEAHS